MTFAAPPIAASIQTTAGGPSSVVVTRARAAMGTRFEARLLGEDAEHLAAVAEAALDEVSRIHALLSRFDPRSEVHRLNRCAGAGAIELDHEVFELLSCCEDAYLATAGCFDPVAASSPRRMRDFALDRALRRARLTHADARLDLGAVGKGYALDRAARVIEFYGMPNFLLHGGGSSVVARGRRERGQPWTIVLDEEQSVTLENESLSVSWTRRADQEASDVMDPARGAPLTDDLGCAVVAATGVEAEILSTALLVMGRRRAERFVRHRCIPARVDWPNISIERNL